MLQVGLLLDFKIYNGGNRTPQASQRCICLWGLFYGCYMTKILFNKPPLTFEKQVNKLLDKGLIISNKKHAEHVLSIVNYYHLKSYLTFFLKEDRFINASGFINYEYIRRSKIRSIY